MTDSSPEQLSAFFSPSDLFDDDLTFAPESVREVWRTFFTICSIPHPSEGEEQLRERIILSAKRFGWKTALDSAGNVRVDVPGKGQGQSMDTGIVLQAHLDMVLKAADGRSFAELARLPIEPTVSRSKDDKPVVTAVGTTLGADNGIGVAAALALARDNSLADTPPIRLLFTVNEERGLVGARSLSKEFVTGGSAIDFAYCLGLDCSDANELRYGSAGSQTMYASWPTMRTAAPAEGYEAISLTLDGFSGGHSGLAIQRTHANPLSAIAYLVHDLFIYSEYSQHVYLRSLNGGSNRNSIPTFAQLELVVASSVRDQVVQLLNNHQYIECLRENLEDNLTLSIEPIAHSSDSVLSPMNARNILRALRAIPHGVLSWYTSSAGQRVPGCSLNIGRVATDESEVRITILPRAFEVDTLSETVHSLSETLRGYGATLHTDAPTPGWIGNQESSFASLIEDAASSVFYKPMEHVIRHSGQETGILAGFFAEGNIFGLGPNIRNHHEPEEYVEIDSVTDFYALLKNILLKLSKNEL